MRSTGAREGRDDPIAAVRVDCDELEHSATPNICDGERCATESSYPEQHGIGSSLGQPSEAMPSSLDHLSGTSRGLGGRLGRRHLDIGIFTGI